MRTSLLDLGLFAEAVDTQVFSSKWRTNRPRRCLKTLAHEWIQGSLTLPRSWLGTSMANSIKNRPCTWSLLDPHYQKLAGLPGSPVARAPQHCRPQSPSHTPAGGLARMPRRRKTSRGSDIPKEECHNEKRTQTMTILEKGFQGKAACLPPLWWNHMVIWLD